MRKSFAFLIALATLAVFAEQASADNRPIGKHGPGKVYNACNAAGGTFTLHSDLDGSYGCVKNNCDGKGGTCTVACDKNQNCRGETPGRTAPPPGMYDLVKILKFSPALPPRAGLLEPGQGTSQTGPSGVGTPKPTAPAPVLR